MLFLDEPTVGLDPQTRSSIWEYINDLKKREDITIFLTTHYMDEAENCDRIAIIDHGKIVAIDTPERLKASIGKDRVQIAVNDDQAAIAELKDRFGLDAAMSEGMVTFNVEGGEQFVPRLFAGLTEQIKSVSVARPTLDDVFMSYTGKTIRDAEATVVYPGVLAMSVLFTAIFSAASIVWDREFGFLREMLVAPVSRSAIVIGKCLGGATVATFQGIVIPTLAGLAHVSHDTFCFSPYSVSCFCCRLTSRPPV